MYFSKNPKSQILICLLGLWLCCGIAAFLSDVVFWWGLVIVPLGATAGVVMGLTYPFALMFKVTYCLVLLIAATGAGVGWWKRSFVWARVLCVLAVVLWCFAGIVGLGTGT